MAKRKRGETGAGHSGHNGFQDGDDEIMIASAQVSQLNYSSNIQQVCSVQSSSRVHSFPFWN